MSDTRECLIDDDLGLRAHLTEDLEITLCGAEPTFIADPGEVIDAEEACELCMKAATR